MTTAPFPQVTDELLSAYIDEAVSDEERRLIELAAAESPEVAWRLESLRATVRLLRELPALSLPRSFVLTPEQVGLEKAPSVPPPTLAQDSKVTEQAPLRPPTAVPTGAAKRAEDGIWQDFKRGWQRFWQGGSPPLRNAMAVSFAVLLALLITPRFLANSSFISLGDVQTSPEQAAPVMEAVPAEPGPVAPGADSTVVASAEEGETAPAGAVPAEVLAAEAAPPQAESEGAAVAASSSAAAPAAAETGDSARSVGEAGSEESVTTLASPATEDSAAAMAIEPAAGVTQGDAAMAVEAGPPAGVQGSPPSAAESAAAPPAPMPGSAGPQSGSFALEEAREATGGMVAAPAAAAEPQAEDTGSAMMASPDQPLEAQATSAKEGPAAEGVIQPTVVADTEVESPAEAAAADLATTATPEAAAENAAAATPAAVAQGADSVEAAPAAAPAGSAADEAAAQPASGAATAEQAASPGLVVTVLQVAALLAALATLLFALLWWRSRRRTPQVNS